MADKRNESKLEETKGEKPKKKSTVAGFFKNIGNKMTKKSKAKEVETPVSATAKAASSGVVKRVDTEFGTSFSVVALDQAKRAMKPH